MSGFSDQEVQLLIERVKDDLTVEAPFYRHLQNLVRKLSPTDSERVANVLFGWVISTELDEVANGVFKQILEER